MVHVRVFYLHIPRETWLNCLQTVETLIRRRILRHLIWVSHVCKLSIYQSPDYNGFICVLDLLTAQGCFQQLLTNHYFIMDLASDNNHSVPYHHHHWIFD